MNTEVKSRTTFPLFRPAFSVLIGVAVLFYIALYFHLFYTLSWFDMIMHFSGGLMISMGMLTIMTRITPNALHNRRLSYGEMLLWGVGAAVVIGVLWECFELYFGITYWYSRDYWGDNGMDVTMDTLGGLVAVWYAYYQLYFK